MRRNAQKGINMKILLIEDDVEISDMLKKFLGTEGFEVIAAYDGESDCEKFFEEEYSLVLLDLMIPKLNGMEVMNVIREKVWCRLLLYLQRIRTLIKRWV